MAEFRHTRLLNRSWLQAKHPEVFDKLAARLDPMAEEDRADRRRSSLIAGAVSQVGAIGKKELSRWPTKADTENAADLIGKIKKGDIVMTTSPWGKSAPASIKKALVAMGMGHSGGYHAMVVESVDNAKGTMTVLEVTHKHGYRRRTLDINKMHLATVYRHKNAKAGKRTVRNMANYVDFFEDLSKKLVDKGLTPAQVNQVQRSVYSNKKVVGIALSEIFVPQIWPLKKKKQPSIGKRVANVDAIADAIATLVKVEGKVPKKVPFVECLGGTCTTTLGDRGMPVGKKVMPGMVGPNDIARSPDLRKVISHASRVGGKTMRPVELGFKAAPTLIRAGVGIGVMTAASKLIKARQTKRYKYISKKRNARGEWTYTYRRPKKKVASSWKKDPWDRKNVSKGFGAQAAAGAAVGIPAAVGQLGLMHRTTSDTDHWTKDDMNRLRKSMKTDVDVRHSHGPAFYSPNNAPDATYGRKTKGFVNMPNAPGVKPGEIPQDFYHLLTGKRSNSAAILAHELGHSSTGASRLGRAWLKGALLGARGGKALPLANIVLDPDSQQSKMVAPVAGAMQIPLLAEEARASIRGYQGMKGAGYTAKELAAARKVLGSAWGTYGLGAAATVGGAELARRLKKRWTKNRKGKGKK